MPVVLVDEYILLGVRSASGGRRGSSRLGHVGKDLKLEIGWAAGKATVEGCSKRG